MRTWTPMREDEPTALYRIWGHHDLLLYVGIGRRPGDRISAHRRQRAWWRWVDDYEWQWYPTRSKALAAESKAIRTEHPVFNIDQNKTLDPMWEHIASYHDPISPRDFGKFVTMVRLEPRLREMFQRATLWCPSGRCPEDSWPYIKRALREIVGYLADDQSVESLRTAEAYQTAAEVLYRALPKCRDTCVCRGMVVA